MKKYKGCEIIQASKIEELQQPKSQGAASFILAPDETGGEREIVDVTKEFMSRYGPNVGEYYIRHADGWKSCLPPKEFELRYV